MWAQGASPRSHANLQKFLNFISYIAEINSTQICYWFNSKAQNKYFKASKNIGLNFILANIFQGLTGTFSWASLRRF